MFAGSVMYLRSLSAVQMVPKAIGSVIWDNFEATLAISAQLTFYQNKYFAAVIGHVRFLFPTTAHVHESYNTSRKFLDRQMIPK